MLLRIVLPFYRAILSWETWAAVAGVENVIAAATKDPTAIVMNTSGAWIFFKGMSFSDAHSMSSVEISTTGVGVPVFRVLAPFFRERPCFFVPCLLL